MVGPRVVPDPAVDLLVRVAGALGAELPDGPFVAVVLVEELDELVERVAVGALRVSAAGARGRDDRVGYIAQVEAGFRVPGSWAGDDLAEQ